MLVLGGCAGLDTRPPQISASAVALERVRMQQQALDAHIERTKYLQDLAWPILVANRDLCGNKTQRVLGWRVLDRKIAATFTQGLRPRDAENLAFTEDAQVALVIAGGPAEKAGIKPRDRILRVSGKDVGDKSVAAISKQISNQIKLQKKGEALPLTVQQPGEAPREISITPESVCAFPLDLSRNSAINAQTDGKRIAMFLGLMRAETDPRRIQYVIAHELAHAILRHPQKSVRNSVISGGAILGTLGATAGWIVDTTAALVGKKPPASYQRQGAALATWPYGKDFEREADYVGLYALARADIDINGVEELFTTFARESPSGTWLALSHPSAPERWLAVRATADEIKGKRQRGEVLLPSGWKRMEANHGHAK